MPISLVIPPSSLNAAYRPILLTVTATNTDGSSTPPVVYCDIYFNDTFYKTISKTQYDSVTDTNSTWIFDIQDACQEYLGKFIEPNGNRDILIAESIVTKTTCKIRSSGFDSDGFILPEGTPPVQGTEDTPPVAGDGTSSGDFWVFNGTIQHEENQEVGAQLNSYKRGTWRTPGTYPLTHRPDEYKLNEEDNDSFPIISDEAPTDLVLHYRIRGTSSYLSSDGIAACIPVGFEGTVTLPNGTVGVAYNYVINLTGSSPFSFLGSPVKPSWMTVDLTGSVITLSGTPDVSGPANVAFTIQNCSGDDTINISKTITIAPDCIVPSTTVLFTPPVSYVGSAYSYTYPISGTGPFAIDSSTKPSWMTASISGGNLVLGGTPVSGDIGGATTISFTISNACGSITVSGTLVVTENGRSVFVINSTSGVLVLRNANGTDYTFGPSNTGSFKMQDANFEIRTMTGSHKVDILQSLPSAILMSIAGASAGNTYTSPNLTLTNYLRFNL